MTKSNTIKDNNCITPPNRILIAGLFFWVTTTLGPHCVKISVVILEIEFQWQRYRHQRYPFLFQLLQAIGCLWFGPVGAVNIDTMTAGGNMQVPIPIQLSSQQFPVKSRPRLLPGRADKSRLSIQRIIPTPTHKLQPPFCITRHVYSPQPPGVVVFLTDLLPRDFVPVRSAVWGNLNPLRPTSSATICPPFHSDFSVVRNHIFICGGHDSARDRHILDREAGAIKRVVLADLVVVVKIFLTLNNAHARFRKCVDLGKPFA